MGSSPNSLVLPCRVHKGGAVFDKAKLSWMNGHYLRELPDDQLIPLMATEWQQSGGPAAAMSAVMLLHVDAMQASLCTHVRMQLSA